VNYTVAFFEDPREVGEIVYNGARYRVVYDPKRGCASCVLVPGQDEVVGPTVTNYGERLIAH
jgi:hypothetical protein